MPYLTSYQLPPSSSWEDFEILMWDLFKEIWEDPNTQRVGRQGQSQDGIDIWGRPKCGNEYEGVQCKQKGIGKKVEKKVFKEDIEKAKKFRPPLAKFYFVTTAPKDANLEETARLITVEHKKQGLFEVEYWGWQQICLQLYLKPEVMKRHYQDIFPFDLQNIINDNIDFGKELIEDKRPLTSLHYLRKLKEKVWGISSDYNKYRILSNIGSCYMQMGENEKASDFFIEAYNLNRNEAKAIYNCAVAHHIIGGYEKAIELCDEVIEKDSGFIPAYNIKAMSCDTNTSIQEILDIYPQEYLTDSQVSNTIANILRLRGEFTEAEKLARKAIDSNPNNADYKANLGILIIQKVINNSPILLEERITREIIDEMKEAIAFLNEAIEGLYSPEIPTKNIDLNFNKAIALKITNDIFGAISELKKILLIDKNNKKAKFELGQCLFIEDRYTEAIEMLESIEEGAIFPGYSFWLSNSYYKIGSIEKAIEILKTLIVTSIEVSNLEGEIDFIIDLFIEQGNIDSARAILEECKAKSPNDANILIQLSKIERINNNNDTSVVYAHESKKLIGTNSSFGLKEIITREFIKLELFDDAIAILESIISESNNDFFLRRYLMCLNSIGDDSKKNKILRELRENIGIVKGLTLDEISSYLEVSDFRKAEELTRKYLEKFPNNNEALIMLSWSLCKLEKRDELDSILNLDFAIEDIDLKLAKSLISLLITNDKCVKAMKYLFKLIKIYPNSTKLKTDYVGLLLHKQDELAGLLNKSYIDDDMSIELISESDDRRTIWIHIDSESEIDHSKLIYPPDNHISKELKGKKIGDKIALSGNNYLINTYFSKYYYLLNQFLVNSDFIFHEDEIIKFDMSEYIEKNKIPENMIQIFKGQEKYFERLISLYKDHLLTISMFSKLTRKNIIETWKIFTTYENLGIICSSGNKEEHQHAESILQNNTKVILDIITLISIHTIRNGCEIIPEVFTPYIASSTYDWWKQTLEELKNRSSEDDKRIVLEDDHFVLYQGDRNSLSEDITLAKKILKWIETHCTIIPSYEVFQIPRNERFNYYDTIGQSTIDSILLARQIDGILYSEDYSLRIFAYKNFGVDCIWSQPVILYCFNKGIISAEEYNNHLIDLINHGYRYISITSDTLILAVKKSGWKISKDFEKLSSLLNGKRSSTESSLICSIIFFVHLSMESMQNQAFRIIIFKVLDDLVKDREFKEIIIPIIHLIPRTPLFNYPFFMEKLYSAIESWKIQRNRNIVTS